MGRRVIVVEDDRVLGNVLKTTLEAVGHEVIAVVPTGEEAVILALSTHPDVVVMDVGLAGEMNGIEAAQRLQVESACRLVFHTADADPEHRGRMLALHHAMIVQKPGRIAQLVEAVSSAPAVCE